MNIKITDYEIMSLNQEKESNFY